MKCREWHKSANDSDDYLHDYDNHDDGYNLANKAKQQQLSVIYLFICIYARQ